MDTYKLKHFPLPAKRIKVSEALERQVIPEEAMGYRRKIMDHKLKRMNALKEKYIENASELFFLHTRGNIMDYATWKYKAPTEKYLNFLKKYNIDSTESDSCMTQHNTNYSQPQQQGVYCSEDDFQKFNVDSNSIVLENKILGTEEKIVNSLNQQPVVKLVKLPVSASAPSPDDISNKEEIVEKAKQEAYVMQRMAELQREGLWSEKRLPKVQEPSRSKAHWDYLLEEMIWLSADFAQERKWKKSAAKRCARMVQKYFQEKAVQVQKAEKLEEVRLKKIAALIAREIKSFWTDVEKLVEYKQQTKLGEKRKKVLDQHLNFIVDQTEKYSSWLSEGLNKKDDVTLSASSSKISSPSATTQHFSDDEFHPNQSSGDDEETIAKAEEEISANHKEEVELLKKESELPLEDFLKELPPNYFQNRNKELLMSTNKAAIQSDIQSIEVSPCNKFVKCEVIDLNLHSEIDKESKEENSKTQAKNPKDVLIDHSESLEVLNPEDSGEDIRTYDSNIGSDTEIDSEVEFTDEASSVDNENEKLITLSSLFEDLSADQEGTLDQKQACDEMDNVAALAESIQPKGNTFSTTKVVTKVPFLLKHTLREYQHIGLDWLVTMYERKLNGILADEMGLGKTIQTIALLAHLACEKGNWGPHLIVVPTSVMLNWEVEFKKWCPAFKILTYYGSQRERRQKRIGWTKPNFFHVCITSYKLVIQDHQSFRRKKWKYLILDEAQNIKNFKSKRWQLLLHFHSQRRLLLTGTPLQNNLMELWSLMHFLMPSVFQSHKQFKEWFSNPVTGMIEGNSEYNDKIIRRLHKVLRPFLLRRLKSEVEKQLPKKYEHVIMCRLSKRQRYLYDDFMARAKTKETLASGNLLSVINVLMQLRKVCNHPNLFEVRPTVSPFQMEGIIYSTASIVWNALDFNLHKDVDLFFLNLILVDLEFILTAFVAYRLKALRSPRKFIEEIDMTPESPPKCPEGKVQINVRLSNEVISPSSQATNVRINYGNSLLTQQLKSSTAKHLLSPSCHGVTLKVAGGQQLQGFSLQLVPHHGSVKAIPVGAITQGLQVPSVMSLPSSSTSKNAVSVAIQKDGPKIMHTYTFKSGDGVQKLQVPSFAQLLQTSTGKIIITPNTQNTEAVFPIMTSTGQRLTVVSKSIVNLSAPLSVNKVLSGVVASGSTFLGNMPVTKATPDVSCNKIFNSRQENFRTGLESKKSILRESTNSIYDECSSKYYISELEDLKKQNRLLKLKSISKINEFRCCAYPVYGEDLQNVLMSMQRDKNLYPNRIFSSESNCFGFPYYKNYFSHTDTLIKCTKSMQFVLDELEQIFDKFILYVPSVQAPMPFLHVFKPSQLKLRKEQNLIHVLETSLKPKFSPLHKIFRAMSVIFPEPRLIEYDCGKLQALNILLRNLKSGSHRVLIFTQMTRMLDVFEAFMNYHGYKYLRLDGTTKVEQRQLLMERFNNDERIFCFILSTRSGGIGVNLTGADTVIFYDSDWNPTMDAQAQDRCHRIGQTRDVHIYRLVCELTVEENILKKANQKRLLGDLAIEGGNFTTAYFRNATINDLFSIDQTNKSTSLAASIELDQCIEKEHLSQFQQVDEKTAIGALENAIAAVEEDLDVQATKTAKDEAIADLAEFNEDIPIDDVEKDDTHISKAEMDLEYIVQQLKPIERYAMRFLEDSDGTFSAAQLAAAEKEIEEQKKEWELDRLRVLKEDEERLATSDCDDVTIMRQDSFNQVTKSNIKKVVCKNQYSRRKIFYKVESKNCNFKVKHKNEPFKSQDHTGDTEHCTPNDKRELLYYHKRGDKMKGDVISKCSFRSNSSKNRALNNDINIPRTRSRGDVKINLWTLDASPILSCTKMRSRNRNKKSLNSNESSSNESNSKPVLFGTELSGTVNKILQPKNSSKKRKSKCNINFKREVKQLRLKNSDERVSLGDSNMLIANLVCNSSTCNRKAFSKSVYPVSNKKIKRKYVNETSSICTKNYFRRKKDSAQVSVMYTNLTSSIFSDYLTTEKRSDKDYNSDISQNVLKRKYFEFCNFVMNYNLGLVGSSSGFSSLLKGTLFPHLISGLQTEKNYDANNFRILIELGYMNNSKLSQNKNRVFAKTVKKLQAHGYISEAIKWSKQFSEIVSSGKNSDSNNLVAPVAPDFSLDGSKNQNVTVKKPKSPTLKNSYSYNNNSSQISLANTPFNSDARKPENPSLIRHHTKDVCLQTRVTRSSLLHFENADDSCIRSLPSSSSRSFYTQLPVRKSRSATYVRLADRITAAAHSKVSCNKILPPKNLDSKTCYGTELQNTNINKLMKYNPLKKTNFSDFANQESKFYKMKPQQKIIDLYPQLDCISHSPLSVKDENDKLSIVAYIPDNILQHSELSMNQLLYESPQRTSNVIAKINLQSQ